MQKVSIENGYYSFKLDDLLEKKKIIKNKLMRDTNADFKVIQRIITGKLTKLDIIVLARLCNYLDCRIEDIVTYYPSKEKDLIC